MPGKVVIHTKNFLSNLDQLQAVNPATRIIPVLKADAYGHGAKPLAKALIDRNLDYLAFANVEEAFFLDEIRYPNPVLILGANTPLEVITALEKGYTASLASFADLELVKTWLADHRAIKAKVHLKFDTGMNRAGIAPEDAGDFLRRLQALQQAFPNLQIEACYTHMIRSDAFMHATSLKQFQTFEELHLMAESLLQQKLKTHMLNSAAFILYPDKKMDWARLGIALYGIYPADSLLEKIHLKPVLAWYAPIVNLHQLEAGATVSYYQTFQTSKPSLIATLGIGYGDGYKRVGSNKAWVLYRGKRRPVVGTICMDMTMIDLGEEKDAKIGDWVCLIGQDQAESISANTLGGWCDTIGYEIACGVQKRNHYQYI